MTTTPDQERAAIVAWLRGQDSVCDCFAREEGECACGGWDGYKRTYPSTLADAIERGDHKGE